MKFSEFLRRRLREVPAEAEIASHRLDAPGRADAKGGGRHLHVSFP